MVGVEEVGVLLALLAWPVPPELLPLPPVIYIYLDRMGERASHWKWLGGGEGKAGPKDASPAPAE